MCYEASENSRDFAAEMHRSYINYGLSVVTGRALPDARDGLKPVHRRILFAQSELGNTRDRPHKKSARIVGDVIGKYHPHGDSAVYEALVRLAQPFAMREPLADGQGNFGSIDGDPPAAMRYTEVRMSRLAGEFLVDLDKETVDFRPNYDGSLSEPVVLPTRVPNLLLNGSSGIAVGMATNIPPHNLGELCDACLALLKDENAPLDMIQGPDFPTGGVICTEGLQEAYANGRGQIRLRGVVEDDGPHTLVITELPYACNKAQLVERMAKLVDEGKLQGIADIRDLSNREGIRILIDLKHQADPRLVRNNLFLHTGLETTFGLNLMAVHEGLPKCLSLRQALRIFIEHRREVIIRRTRHDLSEKQREEHVLQGLMRALDHLDAVINDIRAAANPAEAEETLMARYELTKVQAGAVLGLRLQRLTALRRQELIGRTEQVGAEIAALRTILHDPEERDAVIGGELMDIRIRYASPRLTKIVPGTFERPDWTELVPDTPVVVALSMDGFLRAVPLEAWRCQRRGGKGANGVMRRDDMTRAMSLSSRHQTVYFFSNQGRCYYLPCMDIPEVQRTGKGKHVSALLPLAEGESIAALVSLTHEDMYDDACSLVFVTRQGQVKRSLATLYAMRSPDTGRSRKNGLPAIKLAEGDDVMSVFLARKGAHMMLASRRGRCLYVDAGLFRPVGRLGAGLPTMRLENHDGVIAACCAAEGMSHIFSLSEKGYGKYTPITDFPMLKNRRCKGVRLQKVTERTGECLTAFFCDPQKDDILVMTSGGKAIRFALDFRSNGRNAQGVRVVELGEDETILDCVTVPHVAKEEAEPVRE